MHKSSGSVYSGPQDRFAEEAAVVRVAAAAAALPPVRNIPPGPCKAIAA